MTKISLLLQIIFNIFLFFGILLLNVLERLLVKGEETLGWVETFFN